MDRRMFLKTTGFAAAQAAILSAAGLSASGAAKATVSDNTLKPLFFDIVDNLANPIAAPIVEPTVVVELDTEYGGHWVVAGDLDGDGQIEIVSAKNVTYGAGPNDHHYTSSVVAQKLDGSILWRWGNPAEGRRELHHDVGCQIYDWNGNGKNDVIITAKDALIELDGATGRELRRIPLPDPTATDCLTFCNLNNSGRVDDLILKNRYQQMWALDETGKLLWTKKLPGGSWLSHSPLPVDITGNGLDEIFCGYAMLDAYGSIQWVVEGSSVNLSPGRSHVDSYAIIRKGNKPADWLFALTFCGGHAIAVIDGLGRVQWEQGGYHFESIDYGQVFPIGEKNIVVDLDHVPRGQSPIVIFDVKGRVLGRITTEYSRSHKLVDWDGDGFDEIVVGFNKGIYNYRGEKIAQLGNIPGGSSSLQVGNFMGKGHQDILFSGGLDRDKLYIFENVKSLKSDLPLGTKTNYTLY